MVSGEDERATVEATMSNRFGKPTRRVLTVTALRAPARGALVTLVDEPARSRPTRS